ncbi:MAG: D-amino acid oxidase family protein [Caulobacteraceae bacterium]|nr:D-amino acid oxidase family protein [Caulobacteraceae bacterium]
MAKGPEVLVAGAGALGLATALALADAGCRVTVCDPAPVGANASGVAAGMLAPVFEAALDARAEDHFDLLLAARDLWPGLAARAGIALDRSGALAVGEADWLDKLEASARVRVTRLGGATARGLAPGLSPAFGEALWSREDWRLDAMTSLAALRSACEAGGVQFRDAAVQGRGDADLLVVATGAAQGLAPELSRLAPIKGHILRLATGQPAGAVVRAADGYAAPWSGGLAVGATMEAGIGDPAVDPAKAAALLAVAERLFPGAAAAPYELMAGVRAATADGLPLVGFSAAPGVLLAVGARRNGWLLAPLAARIIAACATGGEAGPYATLLHPGRLLSPD